MLLRLHSFLPHSRANGPGTRAVVWTQGCSLGCPGCFNPETHVFAGGELVEVTDLLVRIHELGDSIEGVTVSGGEPLQQAEAVLSLLLKLRGETNLSVLLFTGFHWDEISRLPRHEELLACVDVLLAGRYDARQRIARGLRGSANKTVYLPTGRYTTDDLGEVPEAEVVIGLDGDVILSGIEPVRL